MAMHVSTIYKDLIKSGNFAKCKFCHKLCILKKHLDHINATNPTNISRDKKRNYIDDSGYCRNCKKMRLE